MSSGETEFSFENAINQKGYGIFEIEIR